MRKLDNEINNDGVEYNLISYLNHIYKHQLSN